MRNAVTAQVTKLPQRLKNPGEAYCAPDIFVHMETLRRCGFTELLPSQTVLVRYGRGPHGLMAADIKPDKPSGPSPTNTH